MEAGIPLLGRRALAAFVATMLVASVLFLLAGPVEAASVSPEFLPGASNTGKTCGDNEGSGQTWYELKVDPGAGGSYTDGKLSVTITNYTANGFDWSSNIGVDAVIVKTGVDGANLYRYDPPSESLGDTGLVTPGNNGISHISFCYDKEHGSTTTSEAGATTTTEKGEATTTEAAYTTTTGKGDTTTTGAGDTTTTGAGDTTTTESGDTTTTANVAGGSVTTAPEEVTTTLPIDDEVKGTSITAAPSTTEQVVDDLPFTGANLDMLALFAAGLGLIGALVLVTTRKRNER